MKERLVITSAQVQTDGVGSSRQFQDKGKPRTLVRNCGKEFGLACVQLRSQGEKLAGGSACEAAEDVIQNLHEHSRVETDLKSAEW